MDDGSQSDFTALADAIADLPERERLVFTLCYYEELEIPEIALALGEALFAVLQLYVSALDRLKARLADPEPAVEADGGRDPSSSTKVIWTQKRRLKRTAGPPIAVFE